MSILTRRIATSMLHSVMHLLGGGSITTLPPSVDEKWDSIVWTGKNKAKSKHNRVSQAQRRKYIRQGRKA